MRRLFYSCIVVVLSSSLLIAQNAKSGAPIKLPGLVDSAQVVRDLNEIAHLKAANDHDLMFLQGYTHAQDRLFQMDFYRHLASGTLAELVGPTALPQDVQLRTIGLRRAAARSWDIASPRTRMMLQAYAEGVNAYALSHSLPPEYTAIGVSEFDPWGPVDSLVIGKLIVFQLCFDTFDLDYTVALMTYQQAGALMGFDGAKLFSEDLFRSAPFDPAATLLDASSQSLTAGGKPQRTALPKVDAKGAELSKRYLDAIKDIDFFKRMRETQRDGASNEWAVSGKFTASGAPLMANDPHLGLNYPPIWYPIHLSAGSIDVIGNSFAGTPMVTLGHNRWISWGATTTYDDVTDYYQEQLQLDASSPSGLSTLYNGTLEHVERIPQVFLARISGQLVPMSGNGIPAFTLIVPRRNNGPILQLDQSTLKAVSVQWTGFSGSRELDATITWAEARTREEFERGVRLFTGPQNFAYIDHKGNFGYYMSGELPIREDLQAGMVAGLPPYLLRNGQGGNEWLPVTHPQPQQALPYEILPFNEMPHVLNPPAGWVVNANNDPVGLTLDNNPLSTTRTSGGIYYIAYQFNPGLRAGRITSMLKDTVQRGNVAVADMQKIQADTVLRDAQFFVPFITQAFDNAKRDGAAPALGLLANDPAVAEATERLRVWDFTTPTGIAEGFDGFDIVGQTNPRTAKQIANSVAATLYSAWRSNFVAAVIDNKLKPFSLPLPDNERALTALRHLLETFETTGGIGTSGFNFFAAPTITNPSDRRDLYILSAVKDALTSLASSKFEKAFANSTNQDDYRWGKLHRIVFAHPLGQVFSVPSAGGSPLPNLPGFPVDGGYSTVDAASHSIRAIDENGFMFNFGTSQRSVAEGFPDGVRGVSSLPGGVSGIVGSASYTYLLPQYLVNGAYDQLLRTDQLVDGTESVTKYIP